MIRTNEEILQLVARYEQQDHNGIKSGIDNLDDIIRLERKRFTILTSNENQGKTTFLNFYSYMMARTHGMKTLFLTFENDENLFYDKLKRVYKGNEYVEYSRFLPYDDFRTIDDIFYAIEEYRTQWGFDILCVDPFESLQLFMNNNYRSEDYSAVLERFRHYTQRNNLITILCAHQKKYNTNDEEPTIYNIFGSVSFGNKADNVISIRQIEPLKTEVKALKIRHNYREGKKGESAYFLYNPLNERFTPIEKDKVNDCDFAEIALRTEVFKEVANKAENDHLFEPQQPINKGIDNIKAEEQKTLETQNKAFLERTKVSVYNDFKYVQDVTLKDALTMGKEHIEHIDHCRQLKSQGEENEYKELKRQLPSFTTCGTFTTERKADKVIHYNNMCTIDLDDLEDVEKAKADVTKLPFVLYAAKSVGGKGLFCLIRVDGDISDYLKHWYALKDDFANIGYKVDESCKDVSRLRFVSHDENPYINYKATIYRRKKEIQIKTPSTHCQLNGNENKLTPKEQQVLNEIIADVQTNHLQLSQNHADTLYLASVISSIMGEDGRQYLHVIRQQRRGYDARKIDDLYDYAAANNTEHYTLGALIMKYKQAKRNSK